MQKSKMRKVLEDILKMGYYKNYAAASGLVHNITKHEDAVEDIFSQHGLTKSEISKISKKLRDELLKTGEYPEMEDNSYISQPCGTHDSPDFLVKLEGRLYFIECKSVSKGTTSPMFNSGMPKTGYIYVFSCEKYDETTLFCGEDILEKRMQQLIHEYDKKAKQLAKDYNELIRPNNSHGIEVYPRLMLQHKGGRKITDYFKHSQRDELEQNALNYV